MAEAIRKNEKCFIGMPSCGYIYESAKSCFIACPADERYSTKLDVIKTILESKQYEYYIALQKLDPANFAFCTKICSRIIQSQFCIVLLDYSETKKGKEMPNPNVHMEYGMMLSQNKHVIPLQNEKYSLSFNIAPLDTIKYTEGNFKTKVTEAIENAIAKFSMTETPGQIDQGNGLLTYYNINGFILADTKLPFYDHLYQIGKDVGFYILVDKIKLKYKYIALFDYEDPKKIVLHTKILIDNINNTFNSLISNLGKNQKQEDYEYLNSDITIDLVIPSFYEKKDILDYIHTLTDSLYKDKITIYYRTDYEDLLKMEYQKIPDFKVKQIK